jgi:hypothetical protein
MNLNKKMNRTVPLLLLVLLVAGSAVVAPVVALKVSGARIALDVTPGQTTTSPIGISIGADEAGGTYAIDVLGFGQSVADGSYTSLDATADTSAYSARPFITVDKPTVQLTPGGSASVTATIAVPADAKDGGRYAIILVHPASAASGAPAAFSTAVAIPVLLTIKGGAVAQKGEITTVEMSKAEIAQPFTVTATVKNSGNYHYYGIVSNVTVNDGQGKAVATVRTTPMSRAIIPGNLVKIPAQVAPGLPEGMYQVTVNLETQDGELLNTEIRSLQVGNPVGSPAAGTTEPGGQKNFLPGPGVFAVCIAAVIGILGGIRITRKGEKKP